MGNEKVKAISEKEFPPELEKQFKKAIQLERITIWYLLTVIIVMFLASTTSQAMKAAWMEDILSMVPALSFLVARRFYERKPNDQFPFGYHRVFSIAFQLGAFALFSLGVFLLIDSVMALIKADRPSIGSVYLFGHYIWLGWLMIAVLLYSSIPSIILGKKKLPLAGKLHNKLLFTDANTQKADWETAFAAIVGILGVGLGLWWADALAACFISVTIIHDGYKRLSGAVLDLIDEIPTNLENEKKHPLVKKLHHFFEDQSWVKDFRIRMREAGDVFFTEIFIIPGSVTGLTDHIEKTVTEVKELDWKLFDVVIMPVKRFTEEQDNAG
ncbi:MAG: cation transporter [Prolixibacteraceae bacterium]